MMLAKKNVTSNKTNPSAKKAIASDKINQLAKNKGALVKTRVSTAIKTRQQKENYTSVPKIHQQFSSSASDKEKSGL
jgi:hypothetical protein